MEKQLEFEFYELDRPCRTCSWWYTMLGTFGKSRKEEVWYGCGMGQFMTTKELVRLPKVCKVWRKGGEKMPFVDFKKMTKEQLKQELEKVRDARLRGSRTARVVSRERRIKNATKGTKRKSAIEYIDE